MSSLQQNGSLLFQQLLDRVEAGTLKVIVGGGVIRGMNTALAKQIVNQHGIHICFSEPTADEEINPQVKTGGDRLEGVYQIMLSACEEKEVEAKQKKVDLKSEPIHLFLKLMPYHLTAEERLNFFQLTRKYNVLSVRDPVRTIESTIIGLLKITRDQRPGLDVKEIAEPGTGLSFITTDSPKTPIAQLVDHILKTRDFSILGEGFLKYFSYYPVLNDPILKLDVWNHYAKSFPTETEMEARKLGFINFDNLATSYKDIPALDFPKLPAILLEPLKFRRTGYASMMELGEMITGDSFPAEHGYVVVESTLLQLRPDYFLKQLFVGLDLPERKENPQLSYSEFDAGHRLNPAIRNALFSNVNRFEKIQEPVAQPPIAPDKLPKCFMGELKFEYDVYMEYLCNPNRQRNPISLIELFDEKLKDGKPASAHHFTTMYALVSVDMDEPQRGVIRKSLRHANPDYAKYFDFIDESLAKARQSYTRHCEKQSDAAIHLL